jgi:Protein of unknown function (DUF3460)
MPLFAKPYRSEITEFIDKLKADKPQLEAEQRAGRALLWDKQVDLAEQRAEEAAALPQPAYVYATADTLSK